MKIDLQQLLRYIPFIVGYLLAFYYKKKYKENKIDDLYLYVLLSGIIGARLTYAVFNVGIFKYDWSGIISVSRYNLNFVGGIIISWIAFHLLCKLYKLETERFIKLYTLTLFMMFLIGNLVEIYLINQFPFYLSMTSISELLILAGLFLVGMLLEIFTPNKYRIKYFSPILIGCVLSLNGIIS
jgi:prolipoprotein diacylglyceryltransferase